MNYSDWYYYICKIIEQQIHASILRTLSLNLSDMKGFAMA